MPEFESQSKLKVTKRKVSLITLVQVERLLNRKCASERILKHCDQRAGATKGLKQAKPLQLYFLPPLLKAEVGNPGKARKSRLQY